MAECVDFLVNKEDLREHRWHRRALPEQLGADEVLLAISAFALTANNITYAVVGERMSYWQFFPTEEGWGRIPVWGFADVVRSNHADIEPGERLYGYFPMSSHLVIRAGKVTQRDLVDVSAHRIELPVVYNQYVRTANDPSYDNGDSAADDAQMLYRPLFMTSFILDDFLDQNDFFAARSVILTSASSKTSLGLAYLLHANRADRAKVVGVTSSANAAFVAGLGCYDEVVSYQDIAEIDRSASVIVDMAGDGEVLAALHNHLDSELKYSCLVGATHWEERGGARDMAGPPPEVFFAPSHIQARNKDWGPGGLERRFADAWQGFTGAASDWIEVEHGEDRRAVEAIYRRVLDGKASPDKGYVLSIR
ncbi:MAG: DUF2855 family protein [Gammaproteobacteria bacterium]|nr:DUF2855 family protein [Gammaproteobacteria bacterium]